MSVLTSYFLYQEKSNEKIYQPKPDMFKENYHILLKHVHSYVQKFMYELQMYRRQKMRNETLGFEFLEPDVLYLNSSSEFTYQLITT